MTGIAEMLAVVSGVVLALFLFCVLGFTATLVLGYVIEWYERWEAKWPE